MVTASGTLSDNGVFKHVGCTNLRLENTSVLVFNGPGVNVCMAPVRTFVNRYTTSSQVALRLAECCAVLYQPQEFQPEQGMAAGLDPRSKMLYGVSYTE